VDDMQLPYAPRWVRTVAGIVRRLPAGRYRAVQAIVPRAAGHFIARLPDDLGGSSFECDLRDAIMRDVCFTGWYAPQETLLVTRLLARGETFVDVGANWGYFTLVAAQLVGSRGRVISIEPHPQLFRLLSRNVARNTLSQVAVVPVAAADRRTTMPMMVHDEGAGNFGLSRLVAASATDSGPTVTVSCDTLDNLLDELGVDVVDLMKMDIEGAEGIALEGLQASLSGCRVKRLLLELHPAYLAEYGRSTGTILRLLERARYRGWSIDHSPAAVRRAAYGGRHNLPPLTAIGLTSRDQWPHELWVAPGVPLPEEVGQRAQ
jgi:FkbM family methyltransferase